MKIEIMRFGDKGLVKSMRFIEICEIKRRKRDRNDLRAKNDEIKTEDQNRGLEQNRGTKQRNKTEDLSKLAGGQNHHHHHHRDSSYSASSSGFQNLSFLKSRRDRERRKNVAF